MRIRAYMQTVRSRDGTTIAFWRSGDGPPLLLVHGATADHSTTWRFVLPELERRFTVYAMDRRGRGGSGDSSQYDLQREAEDVAAVIGSVGGPVNVVGHSYGALCALEAALIAPNLRRLVLYEGVPIMGADLYRPGTVESVEEIFEKGDVEGALLALLRDVVEASPEDIEMLRSQEDAWARRLRNTPTMPRELRAEQRYVFERIRFGNMRAPTLLLVGGDSPPRERQNARAIGAALADARVAILPGQQHTAMYSAPADFVDALGRFLAD
jgi:pimeloyl-ACP methyl ester carboxylesterase